MTYSYLTLTLTLLQFTSYHYHYPGPYEDLALVPIRWTGPDKLFILEKVLQM